MSAAVNSNINLSELALLSWARDNDSKNSHELISKPLNGVFDITTHEFLLLLEQYVIQYIVSSRIQPILMRQAHNFP